MQRRQMYSSDADKRFEVVSYLEAALVFIVFSFVLYALYPKQMLQKQVLAEKSNYDLTAIYLENMLRLEPDNMELTIALLEASIKSGKFDLALKMIDALQKDASVEFRRQLLSYRYEALKVKYFSTNEVHLQNETKEEILALLNMISAEGLYTQGDLEYWYKGSREFSLNTPALFFLYKLLEHEEKALWLKECFYLSSDIKDERLQEECLLRLRMADVSHYNEWTQQAYYLALQEGKIEQALSLLKDMASRSHKWQLELAKFYVELRRYKEGSAEYMKLYKRAKNAKERKKYLLKALEALQFGSLMDEAAALARKYEALYYRDKQMSAIFIKLYLAGNKLQDAKRVSIERLKYVD